MFYTKSDRMFTENAEGHEGNRVPLHNTEVTGEHPINPEDVTSSGSSGINGEGMWGERDVGGPVNFRSAMLEYEDLQRELTELSKTRSGRTNRSTARQSSSGLRKITSATSRRSRVTRDSTRAEEDVEAQDDEKPPSGDEDEEDDFELGGFLKDGHFEKRDENGSAKKVGVIYKNLTVKGVGATSTFVRTLPNAVIGVGILFTLTGPMADNILDRLSAQICSKFSLVSLRP